MWETVALVILVLFTIYHLGETALLLYTYIDGGVPSRRWSDDWVLSILVFSIGGIFIIVSSNLILIITWISIMLFHGTKMVLYFVGGASYE